MLPKFQNGEERDASGNPLTDFNDLHVECGLAVVAEQLKSKTELTNFAPSSEDILKALSDNECGDASLFKRFFGQDFLYDSDDKSFYRWNGICWVGDKEKERFLKLQEVATQYSSEADRIEALHVQSNDEKNAQELKTAQKQTKSLRERAKSLKATRRMNSVLEMATAGSRANGGLTFIGDWDSCGGYLPCRNGLIDLKTGGLLQSGRDHYLRKTTDLAYDESATCPLFEKFIFEIMGDREHLAKFLQRLIGYAAVGSPIEHIFVVLYGALGRNGKGTLIRLLTRILGHLSREFQPALILKQRNPPTSGTPRPDLIHLQGTRFACTSEISKGSEIDSAELKKLSGGDLISARSLFSNAVKNFAPTHTLFIQTNLKPKAPAEDTALWRRAILLPFDVTFVETPKQHHERLIDRHLENRLMQEAPGILRWIVEGAVAYHRYGLLIPSEVLEAVDDYRSENDGIGAFLIERCEKVPGFSAKALEMRDAIKSYCRENDLNEPTKTEIKHYLESKGYKQQRFNDGYYWLNIIIKKSESA